MRASETDPSARIRYHEVCSLEEGFAEDDVGVICALGAAVICYG